MDELKILKEQHFTAICTNNLVVAEKNEQRLLHSLQTGAAKPEEVVGAIMDNFQKLGVRYPYLPNGQPKETFQNGTDVQVIGRRRRSLLDPR